MTFYKWSKVELFFLRKYMFKWYRITLLRNCSRAIKNENSRQPKTRSVRNTNLNKLKPGSVTARELGNTIFHKDNKIPHSSGTITKLSIICETHNLFHCRVWLSTVTYVSSLGPRSTLHWNRCHPTYKHTLGLRSYSSLITEWQSKMSHPLDRFYLAFEFCKP